MNKYGIYFWRSVPLLRLLIPLIAGILLERYLPVSQKITLTGMVTCMAVVLIVRLLPTAKKYAFRWLQGLCIQLLMLGAGIIVMHVNNVSNYKAWIGNHSLQGTALLVTLQENPVKKSNSYKAIAKVEAVWQHTQWEYTKGNILLYFNKDNAPSLQYGSQIVIKKTLQPIADAGNPGGFDYRKYCASQGIYYQAYLLPDNYKVLYGHHGNTIQQWLLHTRDHVLSILRKYIHGEKEVGIAEALLIGYRNDLDKSLVKSYSLTGVVHIIAISGLHLGMIYGLLLLLLKPFRHARWIRWVKPVIVLAVLWGFALLSGAAASILRSAVMFTFIAVGESLNRKTQVYNTLAASAFCMLVYDPYFLWDIGFQLSYLAVLSIMLFMKPIYRQAYFSNKILNAVWQLNAITLSAQLLTLPVVLFQFHQFPNLFLFTNFIAVPLSGFILYGELLLLVCSFIPSISTFLGHALQFLISLMNGIIERTGRLPFAVTDHIQVTLLQTVLLYLSIAFFGYWLLQKKPRLAIAGLACMAGLCFSDMIETMQQKRQHVLVVYNIPKHSSIDIVEGLRYLYVGDSSVPANPFLHDFHLQPSRILYGARLGKLNHTIIHRNMLTTKNKSVWVYDGSQSLPETEKKIPVDLIIIRGSPKLYLSQLAAVFDCRQYVFDSSNPLWKIRYWKKDADSLHLRHHSVPEQGAFIMEL